PKKSEWGKMASIPPARWRCSVQEKKFARSAALLLVREAPWNVKRLITRSDDDSIELRRYLAGVCRLTPPCAAGRMRRIRTRMEATRERLRHLDRGERSHPGDPRHRSARVSRRPAAGGPTRRDHPARRPPDL